MLKKKKTGKKAFDIQTNTWFDLESEVEYDIIAAAFSCIYLMVSLAFFCWLLLDISVGDGSLIKKILPRNIDFKKDPVFQLILYTTIGGGLGGIVNGFRSFISWHAERKAFAWRFIWKYITLPPLGFILAGIVYSLARGGVAAFGGGFATTGDITTQAMSAFGIGALVGYGSHKVFKWLDSLLNKLFKTAKVQEIKAPDLIGKTQQEAEATLKESGLGIGEVNEKMEKDQEKIGKIISQNPPADSVIPKGASVDITIAIKKE